MLETLNWGIGTISVDGPACECRCFCTCVDWKKRSAGATLIAAFAGGINGLVGPSPAA